MYHTVEFVQRVLADVAIPGQSRLEQVNIKKGTRLRAEIRAYVAESDKGPIEMADLFLEDGSAARAVNFSAFRFLDV